MPAHPLSSRSLTMPRPYTLFTGQWADLPFEEVARLASGWGYDGLEIAVSGDHLDAWRWDDDDYIAGKLAVLERYNLKVWAISNHLKGQAVCDLSLIHISEPTRRTPISYAVFCLKKKKKQKQ